MPDVSTEGRLAQLEKVSALSQQALENISQNLNTGMRQLQDGVNGMGVKLEALSKLQGGHEAHGGSIDRLFQLHMQGEQEYRSDMLNIQNQIKEIAAAAASNWTRHLDQTDVYRTAHEADNNAVKQTMSRWNGVAIALSLVANIVLGLLFWIGSIYVGKIDQQVSYNMHVQEQIGALDSKQATNAQRIQDNKEAVTAHVP